MKINQIITQHRRDFRAIYECENCGYTEEGNGYDDSHFHEKVIPAMVCKQCGKDGDEYYRPLPCRYPDDMTV